MATPLMLTKELLQTALKEHFQEKEVCILGYSCTSVVPAGDNYTSDLFRAAVTFKKGQNGNKDGITVIVKSSPRGGMMEELAKSINLFDKEIHMFSKVLPALYEKLNETQNLSSSCYYVHKDGPHSLLLLEDLKQQGFVMHERQNGLNLEHCKIVLKRIAKLHAASYMVYKEDPSLVTKQFRDGLYCNNEMIKHWVMMSYTTCYQYLQKDKNLKKYGIKMEQMQDDFYERCMEATKKNSNGFNVMNHGDLWVNNVMFKYDDKGRMKDMRFVDFQLCKFTSPSMDLHYFFATSPNDELRSTHVYKFLDYYYANFLYYLSEIGCGLEKIPSRCEFVKDFNGRAIYGLLASVTVGNLVKADQRPDASFESLMQNEGPGTFREHCYTNANYKKMMSQLLPFYDSLGVLD